MYQYFPDPNNQLSSQIKNTPSIAITNATPNLPTSDLRPNDSDSVDVQRTNVENPTLDLDLLNNTAPSTHTLTIMIPFCPLSRCSPRLQSLTNPLPDYTAVFLSKYSPVRNTHDLLPADLSIEDLPSSIKEVLAALSNGSIEPIINPDNEPLWAHAMASDECKYWIAGS